MSDTRVYNRGVAGMITRHKGNQAMTTTTNFAEITDADAIINLIDCHTGQILKTYKYSQRKPARNRANKLDLAYGSCRYAAQVVFTK